MCESYRSCAILLAHGRVKTHLTANVFDGLMRAALNRAVCFLEGLGLIIFVIHLSEYWGIYLMKVHSDVGNGSSSARTESILPLKIPLYTIPLIYHTISSAQYKLPS